MAEINEKSLINTNPFKLLTEDNVSLEDAPKNPLIDKWKAEGYTKDEYGKACSAVLGHQEDGRPIMNYNCVLCHSSNCYLSDDWVVPEEDKEAFEKWQRAVSEFYRTHGSELFNKYLGGYI